jgi:hypothetical protein
MAFILDGQMVLEEKEREWEREREREIDRERERERERRRERERERGRERERERDNRLLRYFTQLDCRRLQGLPEKGSFPRGNVCSLLIPIHSSSLLLYI